jgi:Kdo2-lipid IVA lauroyltransferase/acyltransferase
MKKAAWVLEALLCIVLSILLAILPLRWSMKSGEILGLLLFYLWGSRRKIAIENLSKSVLANTIATAEQAEEIIRNNFRNLGRSFVEIIKIFFGLGKGIIDSVDIKGVENFQKAESKGKGIIYITGHCGNWELLAITFSMKVSEISVVARPIDNPYINNFVEQVRGKFGNSVIHKKGALKPIMQTLTNNGCVGILMDQAVLRDEGVVIDFLGRGAWTTKMPALIAKKTSAAVLPAFIHRTDKGHRMIIYPEIELSRSDDMEQAVKEDTVNFSRFIEDYIKAHPTEWLWIHNRWKRVQDGL